MLMPIPVAAGVVVQPPHDICAGHVRGIMRAATPGEVVQEEFAVADILR